MLIFKNPYRLFKAVLAGQTRLNYRTVLPFMVALSLVAALYHYFVLFRINLISNSYQLLPAQLLFETGVRFLLWFGVSLAAYILLKPFKRNLRFESVEISFFYIDVQTFGREFESLYAGLKETIRMKRAIPADIVESADRWLDVTYYDNDSGRSAEDTFDMVVLSVGMTPRADASDVASRLGVELADSGFALAPNQSLANAKGAFPTGSTCGPMSIADAIADGGRAASQAADYLSRTE